MTDCVGHAAIAIGSNSTRLLAKLPGGKELRDRADTRLMLGLDEQGYLTDEAMEKTARAVRELRDKAQDFGVKTVSLYATSATRDAKNAEIFAQRLKEISGLCLHVISGEEEARLAYTAASRGKQCVVVDIGGGSTEVTMGSHGIPMIAVSAQMGASRLMKEGLIGSMADADRAYARAENALRPVLLPVLSGSDAPEMLIGIGGTCTTAAAVHRGVNSHGEELEGTLLTRKEIERQLALLAPMAEEKRSDIPGLYPSRARIMPHGLCILLAVLDLLHFGQIMVSVRNNLDALIDGTSL